MLIMLLFPFPWCGYPALNTSFKRDNHIFHSPVGAKRHSVPYAYMPLLNTYWSQNPWCVKPSMFHVGGAFGSSACTRLCFSPQVLHVTRQGGHRFPSAIHS